MSKRGDHIRKRKDGRWEGRYILARSEEGKIKYRSVYGHSYAEVKTKLSEAMGVSTPQDKSFAFDIIAKQWLEEKRKEIKRSICPLLPLPE